MSIATFRAATTPLLELTAADLMTTPVMTLAQDTPLREAARLLSGSHISGAPVVDIEGRCLGVISSSDFVSWAGEEAKAAGKRGSCTCFIAPWGEMIDIEDRPDDEIHHFMTTLPVTATPTTPIGELAHQMVGAHIHRILVVIDHDQPCGIVTSTDILAAVAKAAAKHAGV
jgi:CBS domain-containing protein